MIEGIDVSYNNGVIDWAKVAAAGIKYALIRVYRSNGDIDNRAKPNMLGARAAGLVVGVYSFNATGAKTRDFVRNVLGSTDGVLVMCDIELSETAEQARAILADFAAAWGRKPIAYIPIWWMSGKGWSSNLPLAFPWMNSNYANGRVQYTYHGWVSTFTQYTDAGSISGIPTAVDRSVYFGTLDQLKAMAGNATEEDVALTDDEIARITAAVRTAVHADVAGMLADKYHIYLPPVHERLDALAAKVDSLTRPASADLTVSGTLHLGELAA